MARPERSFRTPALILQRRDFGEADRLLTVLTPGHGRFNAIAKGARKPTSTRTGHVELFTRADMLINRGRELNVVAQVVMVEPFLPLREDLQRGAYASYATELLLRFALDEDASDPALFHLLDDTYARLCDAPDPRLVVRYYELRLLEAAGFRPELNTCVVSGEPIQPEDQFFSYGAGGVVSPAGERLSHGCVPLSLGALKLLRYLQRSGYAVVPKLDIGAALHNEAERVMLGYITYLLERRLQSVDFIRRIRT